MRRIVEWVTTIPFLILFGLTLGVFDIVGRLVRPFSLRGFEILMGALQRTLTALFAICGTRIHIERHPAVAPDTGYVIIANHQSLFDIVMIGGFLFTNYPKYVAKTELSRWIPSVSLNLRRGGNAIIDRTDRRQALTAIVAMAETAQERNVSVVIFPEGTRSSNGELGAFKRAGSAALLNAADRLEVVPTAIDGSWRLHRMLPVPFGTCVRIRFGEPIPRSPGDADQVIARSHDFIASTLGDWAPLAGR